MLHEEGLTTLKVCSLHVTLAKIKDAKYLKIFTEIGDFYQHEYIIDIYVVLILSGRGRIIKINQTIGAATHAA